MFGHLMLVPNRKPFSRKKTYRQFNRHFWRKSSFSPVH